MKLTRRGKIAVGVVALAVIYGLAVLMAHVNFVDGHYCFHSIARCYSK